MLVKQNDMADLTMADIEFFEEEIGELWVKLEEGNKDSIEFDLKKLLDMSSVILKNSKSLLTKRDELEVELERAKEAAHETSSIIHHTVEEADNTHIVNLEIQLREANEQLLQKEYELT